MMTPSAIYPIIKTWFTKAIGALMVGTLTLPAVILSGCGGDVSGGAQTVVNSGGPVTGARLFVNNVSGDDTNDGITLPFQSLQYALDQLRPGDVLVVQHNEEQPYHTDNIIKQVYDTDGVLLKTLRGYRVTNSGTISAPIIIEGDITSRPVINQQQESFASSSNDVALGLLLDCVSHVVVRNIEITKVNEAGISSSINGACETNNITLEGNRIHRVYGEKYVGGIRLMGVSDTVIRNNEISDVFSQLANEENELIRTGRGLSNIVIDGNTFTNLDSGVIINAQGLGSPAYSLNTEEPVANIQIHNNNFTQVKLPVNFHNQISDTSANDKIKTGLFKSVDVSGNLFHMPEDSEKADSAILLDLGDSEYQSESFCLFNNNFIDTASIVIDISGVKTVEIFNNIFHPTLEGFDVNLLVTRSPENSSLENSIAYSDYNLYFAPADYLSWRLDAGGPLEDVFRDMDNWQNVESHPQLSTKPDADSQKNTDPLFIDQLNNDFRLSVESPALLAGRNGVSIGYDYTQALDFRSNCRALF